MTIGLPRRAWLATHLSAAGSALRMAGVPGLARAQGSSDAATPTVHEHVVGDPAAPVTMIEYSSLTCPHCADFHKEILPELKERYIDTGKVKLVLRDFPLDQVALRAAVIAHCAGDERYYTFINALFANQLRWAQASDPAAALDQLVLAGGLSRERLQACFADRTMENAVLQSRLTAQNEFNVQSTPTFIINGKAYPGTRSVDDFAAIIDPLLPKS
jgi:protein-disulfide isomerase